MTPGQQKGWGKKKKQLKALKLHFSPQDNIASCVQAHSTAHLPVLLLSEKFS